jgi:hypothetical protein
MSILVDLTAEELQELKTLTKQTADVAAIRSAMTEYVRFARRMQLKELSGRVQMEDNWKSLEDLELKGQNGNGQSSAD